MLTFVNHMSLTSFFDGDGTKSVKVYFFSILTACRIFFTPSSHGSTAAQQLNIQISNLKVVAVRLLLGDSDLFFPTNACVTLHSSSDTTFYI